MTEFTHYVSVRRTAISRNVKRAPSEEAPEPVLVIEEAETGARTFCNRMRLPPGCEVQYDYLQPISAGANVVIACPEAPEVLEV